jgi:hypothetical protein
MDHQEEAYDPRFYVATRSQQQLASEVAEAEPHELAPGLYLGSRDCVLKKKQKLLDLGVAYILMCCDRAPDEPTLFEYKGAFRATGVGEPKHFSCIRGLVQRFCCFSHTISDFVQQRGARRRHSACYPCA